MLLKRTFIGIQKCDASALDLRCSWMDPLYVYLVSLIPASQRGCHCNGFACLACSANVVHWLLRPTSKLL